MKDECTMSLKNTEDLATSNTLNLGNTMWIPKNHTNLRWSQTLLCKLANTIIHLQKTPNKKNGYSGNKLNQINDDEKLTSCEVIFNQVGGVRLYGIADEDIPLLKT